MATLADFRAADRAARTSATTAYQRRLDSLWRSRLYGLYRDAANRLAPAGVVAAAAGWIPPDGDELVPDAAVEQAVVFADRVHHQIVVHVMEGTLTRIGVAFDVTNPLADGVEQRSKTRLASVAGTVRRDVLAVVQDAYDRGLSIPDASREIRRVASDLSTMQATRIARTELIGLVNGASVASARLSEVVKWKQWESAHDAKVRPDHAVASGQVVRLADPFVVGGAELQYPGDQTSAPASEVVHCRCTVVYPDGPQGLTAGGAMPKTRGRLRVKAAPTRPTVALRAPNEAAIVAAATPGTRWRALLVPEGVWTSDGRMMEVGSVEWRELPLSLMAQFQTAEGHDEARIAGRIDAITRDASTNEIWGEGEFDSGTDGAEAARLVADQTLRGLSVDLADLEAVIEWVDADGNVIPEDDVETEPAGMRMRATRAVIMGATITPFPAFAEARIELADVPADAAPTAAPATATVVAALTIEPATPAVTDFSGMMVAVYPRPDEADALAQSVDGGQPAEELHVTLAHIPPGPAGELPTVADVVAAVQDAAGEAGVITGVITGLGRFAVGDDGTPLVGLVDALGLTGLRSRVVADLAAAGVEYSTNHDFVPHVTLAYETDGEAAMNESPVGRPVTFMQLSVVGADGERVDLALEAAASGSGGPPPQKPPAQAAEASVTDPVRQMTDPVRRVPTSDELAAGMAAVEAGLLTVNEVREHFGFDPHPGADLVRGVSPETAIVAAALDAITRVGSAPVHVAAPDLAPIAAALHAMAAATADGQRELRDAIVAASQPAAPPVVLVSERGGARSVQYTRDDDGRVTGAQLVEEG